MRNALQIQVAECIGRDLMDDLPLFKDCSDVFLDSVSVLLREGKYQPGETIFRTGEVSKYLYIISKGSVERLLEVSTGRQARCVAAGARWSAQASTSECMSESLTLMTALMAAY